jgi:hypothetical protein
MILASKQPAKQPFPSEFGEEPVTAICMAKSINEEGETVYTTYLVVIEGGKISHINKHAATYSASSAINDATGWLDEEWWEE